MRYTQREGEVVLVKPPVPPSDQEVDRMILELVRHLEREQPYALIFDLTGVMMPSPIQRKKLSQHVRTQEDAIRRNVRGIALVAPSALTRGIATAVFWVAPPPTEWRVFDLLAEATRWAKTRCGS